MGTVTPLLRQTHMMLLKQGCKVETDETCQILEALLFALVLPATRPLVSTMEEHRCSWYQREPPNDAISIRSRGFWEGRLGIVPPSCILASAVNEKNIVVGLVSSLATSTWSSSTRFSPPVPSPSCEQSAWRRRAFVIPMVVGWLGIRSRCRTHTWLEAPLLPLTNRGRALATMLN